MVPYLKIPSNNFINLSIQIRHMKFQLLSIALVFSTLVAVAQKKEIVFNVVFKDKNIGTIHAVKEVAGTKVTSDLKNEYRRQSIHDVYSCRIRSNCG